MGDLLFLAHRVPYPPDRGDKIRSYNILKHLAERHRVHLAAFADDEADVAAAEGLRPLVAKMHIERRTRSKGRAAALALAMHKSVSATAFANRSMAGFVDRLLAEEPIGQVYVFSGQMAQYAPADRPFVMDFVDMDSEKFAAYGRVAKSPMRWMWQREARRLFHFERETARRAVVSLFVSEAEAALFRERTKLGEDQVQVLENGIDLDSYRPAEPGGSRMGRIVFTGQMDYPPNVEAVTSFGRGAFPLIRTRFPEARFAVVGRKPDPSLLSLGEGIVVTGEVSDVRPWLARAAVVVAPLRTARGIQNKVLEAMAMGRPVVASPQAFEGIDAEPGRDLIVADGPQAEAEAVSALLADPLRAEAIGAAARARVEARYAWEARLAPLDAMLEHI
jgi:sugar transferase (PEP-CTERM/EpsH1 system associated)